MPTKSSRFWHLNINEWLDLFTAPPKEPVFAFSGETAMFDKIFFNSACHSRGIEDHIHFYSAVRIFIGLHKFLHFHITEVFQDHRLILIERHAFKASLKKWNFQRYRSRKLRDVVDSNACVAIVKFLSDTLSIVKGPAQNVTIMPLSTENTNCCLRTKCHPHPPPFTCISSLLVRMLREVNE